MNKIEVNDWDTCPLNYYGLGHTRCIYNPRKGKGIVIGKRCPDPATGERPENCPLPILITLAEKEKK